MRSVPESLTGDEFAFYDAVAQNESAVTEMGTDILADIARTQTCSLKWRPWVRLAIAGPM